MFGSGTFILYVVVTLPVFYHTAEGWRRAALPDTTGGQQTVSDLLLCGFVLQAEPLVQFPLTNSLLGQPPDEDNNTDSEHGVLKF